MRERSREYDYFDPEAYKAAVLFYFNAFKVEENWRILTNKEIYLVVKKPL